jgi:hypothetical protein
MRIDGIELWLTPERTASTRRRYAHQLVCEDRAQWADILSDVQSYFRGAHDDAIRHMRGLAGISLYPLRRRAQADPARNYPCRLHSTVLKGYFGEVFAGLLAENIPVAGRTDWEVPAFLFRNHRLPFQQLERYRQTGQLPGPIPGRFGDDCLGFRRNARGTIVAVLFCESKCTAGHDTTMVADAHQKLSDGVAVDVLQLIEILADRDTPESAAWVNALRRLHLTLPDTTCERVDLVCYVCGQHPAQSDSWLRRDRPHPTYTTNDRHLEAIEVHLHDVNEKVAAVYDEESWT